MMDWGLVLSMMTLHALTFLTIGPDNLLVVSKTVGQGFKYGIATISGIVCAGFIQVPLVVYGLDYILGMNETMWILARCAGGSYLVYMGCAILKNAKGDNGNLDSAANGSHYSAFSQGFITNLTNPKVLLILTVFLPQFVSVELRNISFQLFVLGIAMKVGDLVWFTVTALVFNFAQQRITSFGGRGSSDNLPMKASGLAISGVGLWMIAEAVVLDKM